MQHLIIQREILIDAPLIHVWQLVATEEGLRQWWGNTIFLESKEGGRCEEWRSDHQRSRHWQGVVTTYAPPHQLMLTLRAQEGQQDEPELTTIAIMLEATPTGEQTRVHVTQRAFGTVAASGKPLPAAEAAYPNPVPDAPLAQLQRPAPGAYPLPDAVHIPAIGRIEPADTLFTRQKELLTLTWQRRLTSLVAYATTLTDNR
jgi:uncharacterized protein YndB with AHSA1/START domain